jgi:hypothetical protein
MAMDNSRPLHDYTMDELLRYISQNVVTCVIAAQIADDKQTCRTFMYWCGNSAAQYGLADGLYQIVKGNFLAKFQPFSENLAADYDPDKEDDDGDDTSNSPAD